MFDTHIVWSNGSNTYRGKPINQFANKQLQTIAEFTKIKDNFSNQKNKEIDKTKKIYFMYDCMFFLTKKGEVYQKGNFPYLEKKNENKIKKLKFENDKGIKKIKIGLNHILFLDNGNLVHSMGDNFYGQLGLNSYKIKYSIEPKIIEYFSKIEIEKIYTYKNTSFAIDKDKRFYCWGSSEYISNYTGNLFKPTQLFRNLSVNSINCMSNRILINGFELEGIKKNLVKEKELYRVEGKKNYDDKIKNKEEEEKNKNKNIKKNKIVSEEEKIQFYRNIFLKSVLKVNKILSKILNYYSNSNNDSILKSAFNFFTKENTFIIKHDQKHPQIINLNDLLQLFYIKREEKLTNYQKDSLKNSIFYFYARQKILKKLNQFEYQNYINKFSNEIDNIEEFKNKDKIFENKDFENEKDEEEEKKVKMNFIAKLLLNNYIDKLLKKKRIIYTNNLLREILFFFPFSFKFKKIQSLIYRMSLHNLIYNTYEVLNVKNALEETFKSKQSFFGKNRLIIDKMQLIKNDIKENFDSTFLEIDVLFKDLINRPEYDKNYNYFNENDNERILNEKFIYKNIIESTIYIRDLWEKLIQKLEEENLLRFEIEKINEGMKYFKELNGIQNYLETIKFKFYDENEKMDEKIINEKKTLVQNQLNQIDGALNRLNRLKYDIMNNENFKKTYVQKIILIYISSISENCYMKKAIWLLLYNQYYKDYNLDPV
jgi:alpha-tubulin suppressor-like RCC1 family protein